MPNNPPFSNVAKNPTGGAAGLTVSAAGTLNASQTPLSASTLLNQSAEVVVKATPGQVYTVNVVTAGSTNGSLHDCATTGAVAAGNLVFTIPEAVGNYPVNFPFKTGIVYVPGTSMVAAIAYE